MWFRVANAQRTVTASVTMGGSKGLTSTAQIAVFVDTALLMERAQSLLSTAQDIARYLDKIIAVSLKDSFVAAEQWLTHEGGNKSTWF